MTDDHSTSMSTHLEHHQSKKCARASLRAKPSWKTDWNSHSSSMNPSTSLGVRSNVGRAKASPSVRQAGNIRGLLVNDEGCRRNISERLLSCQIEASL